MRIKEWIGENIGYRFFGCCYNLFQTPLFNFIKLKIPKSFFGKNISDLGCGDGGNTLRIKRIFKAKSIVGYDRNDFLLERAKKKGVKVIKLDLNRKVPTGEMAAFAFSLHHLKDKEKVLREAKKNFDYLFLCEPIKDLYHTLFDAGEPLRRKEWIKIFNRVLKKYTLCQFKNNLIVFYNK